MKSFRTWWSVLPASALVFSSCGKKEQEQAAPAAPGEVAAAPAVVAPVAPVEPPAPVVKALTPGERAAMLGIVGHLSKDAESVMAIYDGKEIVKRLKSLKSWDFIRETAKEVAGADPEEEIAAGAEEAGKFLGQEMFIATGKGTTPQFANLIKLSQRSNYFQMRVMTQAFVAGTKEGDLSGMASSTEQAMTEMAKELGKEMALIESAVMPPVLFGLKTADADALGMVEENLAAALENFPSMFGEEGVAPVEFSQGGATFKGYKLAGATLATSLEEGRADIEEMLEPADVDRLIATLKTKNLVIAHGTLGDYAMLYLGGDDKSCPLVDKVEDSLAANDGMAFVDGYQGKKLAGLVYGEQGLAKAAVVGSLKELALGVRDGLAGSEGFGDTRELASLLEMVGEKEDALLGLAKTDALGGLIVLEDGVKFELFGGTDRGGVDHAASHQLGGLGGGEDVLLFGNWVGTPEYSKRAREYGEVIVESAYAIAGKMAGLKMEGTEELAQFQEGFALFDDKFRSDALGLWDAMGTADAGLGKETALVVDLKGAMPPLPGVPQELVDGGRFLRASMIMPVTDRAKLKDSWSKLDGSLKNIFKTVSEMTGEELPMQKPISSEKDGLMTYFFSFPFFNDDFLPSVTVNDKWFVASTSKLQALDLTAAADGETASARKGAWLELDFDVLRKFTADWVALLEKDGEAALGGPEQFAAFKEQLPRIRKGLAAFEEFDGMSVAEYREGGTLRTSLHFKLR
jgi:hypothetical protein